VVATLTRGASTRPARQPDDLGIRHGNPWPTLWSFVISYTSLFAFLFGVDVWLIAIALIAALLGLGYWNSDRLTKRLRAQAHEKVRSHFMTLISIDTETKQRLIKIAVHHYDRFERSQVRRMVAGFGSGVASLSAGLAMSSSENQRIATAGAFLFGFGFYLFIAVVTMIVAPMDADSRAFVRMVALLRIVERRGHSLHSPAVRRRIVASLESIARDAHRYLGHQSGRPSLRDRRTKRWSETQADDVADGIRALKRLVMIPSQSTFEQLNRSLARSLVQIGDGHWASLPTAGTRRVSRSTVRRATATKVLTTAGALGAGLWIATSGSIESQLKGGMIGALTSITLLVLSRSAPGPVREQES
jgi:hypothetical protein